MKLLILFTFLLAAVTALELSQANELDARAGRPHKKTTRPKKFSGAHSPRASRKPSNAPAGFSTGMATPSVKKAKAGLTKLPSNLIDPDGKRRRDSLATLRKLQNRQITTQDFFECTRANPAPNDADCSTIVDLVFASNDELVLDANSCVTFSFGRCVGFFCSLCETLATNTDFIGNQLDSVEVLCTSKGQAGTIVGEDPPQWDAGFVAPGAGLPSYDVC